MITIDGDEKLVSNNDSYILEFYKIIAIVLFTIGLTFFHLVFFAIIKNSTHKMSIELSYIDSDLIEENRRLIMTKSSFDKTYTLEKLQQLAKDKLNLHFSDVRQVVDIEDIVE